MRRFLLLSVCLAAVLISSCTSGTAFPEPTGKGFIRAINAISTSPTISFLIEERIVATVDYKTASSKTPYDDFEYTFNFEALLPGNTQQTRLASRTLQIVTDMDYTFVVGGDLATPTITVWERPDREFAEGGTVLDASIGHMSPALGDVDIFLADPAIVPVAGNEIGTLTPGDKLPPIDLEAGEYVLTITTAGVPGAVLFTSEVLTLQAASTLLFIIFDTDGNDRGPVSVRGFDTTSGATIIVTDPLFPPTIRFIHASLDLGAADIFIDDPLTTPLIEDQDFLGISAELEVPIGLLPITYTAFDNIGTIFLDEDIPIVAGARIDYIIAGQGASPFAIRMLPVRRSIETLARFAVVYTETNHDPLDFYIIVADTDIADAFPRYISMLAGNQTGSDQLVPGSFDLYLTIGGEKTVVAGPVRLDVALGDVVTAIVYDTVDTTTADIILFADF